MISELQNLLSERLQNKGVQDVLPIVTATTDTTHGDYATNVAFLLAKKLKMSPMEAASMLANDLAEDMPESLTKVEVAAPGFINLTLSDRYLIEKGESLLKGTSAPLLTQFSGKKIMIEFTDPNPFKEFHIGHLYDNIIGESLSRLLEATGGEVRRVSYQGDVGLHVAKSLYGIKKLSEEMPDESSPLKERAKFLGKAYALGSSSYEEDESAKQEIIEINKKVYEKDSDIIELYQKGRQWSLDYFETIYERLGTTFWRNYFESEAGPIGLALVKEYVAKGIFKESDGAVIFPGEEYGLHTRVFINSLGLPTYEAKELGLAPTKYKDFAYEQSIIITGNEINEYFKVLLKALSIIAPDLAEKTLHISHGMVRLPEGKMSSRTGNVKTGEWLLDEAKERASQKIKEVTQKESRVLESKEDETAEIVGVGAVKYALLKSSIGKDIEFNFDDSVSFEGNSGPYLQYTYVRTQSVLEKAGGQFDSMQSEYNLNSEERHLLILLNQFDDVVISSAESYSPSTLCTYLFELAQAYNLFYQKHTILTEEGDTKAFRLSLTTVVGKTLKNGLLLLGIKSPEKM